MAVKTVFQLLPKEFDEKVVKLHFPVLGAELTVLTHIKPQVDRFVFPDGHLVIVLASGRLRILGRCRVPLRSRFLRSLFIEEFHKPTRTISSSWQKRSTRKWRKLHFPALGANYRRSRAPAGVVSHWSSMGNSSSPSRAPAGVVPHTRSSMGNSSSPSRAPPAERSRSGSRDPKL